MDLKDLVGNAATVVTIASFLSGAIVCKNIYKKGTSGELSSLPFVAGTLCSVLWLRYGLYLDDSSLIYVNTIGTVLNLGYTSCFYLYATYKAIFHKQVISVGLVLVTMTFYLIYLGNDVKTATYITGMMACGGSLFFCASPLFTLANVLKTKSVEALPFPVILSTFVVCTLWYFYGLLVHDAFIQVPNLAGSLLTGFQLSLFLYYPSSHSQSRSKGE